MRDQLNFLDLLANECDPSRIANIRLGATGALRDLIAKHTIAQLTAVIRSDEAVQLSLTTILRRLSADGFDHAAEVQLLRSALKEATAQTVG